MPSNVDVQIHPQAILLITDNISRKPYSTVASRYLCGAVLGTCENNVIEVASAMEVPVTENADGTVSIDRDFYQEMLADRSAANPTETPIGWYAAEKYDDSAVAQLDSEFRSIDGMESLIRIEFDQSDKQMVKVFLNQNTEYVQVDFNYELNLGERIAMLQLQKGDDTKSQAQFTKDAFAAMNENLGKVETYLSDVAEGKREFDPTLVRQCATLARWFAYKDEETEDEFDAIEEESELALMAGMMFELLAKTPNI